MSARIAVIDLETDPFLYGREPEAFAADYFDGETHVTFWGDDCVNELLAHLGTLPPGMLIYAHNGGKFDFFFMLDGIENPIRMINGRLVECVCEGHVLRDSFSIIPIPLSAYQKDVIDYAKFERDVRENHKVEIIEYLHGDTEYLYRLVSEFAKRFTGARQKFPPLTIGSTALKQLRKYHPQKLDTTETHDIDFRQYYFGGRVQCFESGIIEGVFKVFDVNSMYPYVMWAMLHPMGMKYVKPNRVKFLKDGELEGFEGTVFFVKFVGESRGHVPHRLENGNVEFTPHTGVFCMVSHEFKSAYSKGFISILEVLDLQICIGSQKFSAFVEKFSAEKVEAKRTGDKVAEIFSKLILNSAYGKFSQNPRKFRDWFIERLGRDEVPEGFKPKFMNGDYRLWEKQVDELKFNDVAIAASITSAARAVLLDGIYRATRVIYCDTDSIICESAGDLEIHESKLGAWKYEGEGTRIAIGGKKMYCLTGPTPTKKVESVGAHFVQKKAAKGAKLSGQEIFDVSEGKVITWDNPAPAFNLSRETAFISRRIRKTGDKMSSQ